MYFTNKIKKFTNYKYVMFEQWLSISGIGYINSGLILSML